MKLFAGKNQRKWGLMEKLTFETRKKREILDITDEINRVAGSLGRGKSGICFVNVLHTTAAVATADLDPGTDLDMLDAFEEMVPHLRYRHPHNPEHVPDPTLPERIERPDGRGLFLIRKLVDDVRFNERGNTICMILRRA